MSNQAALLQNLLARIHRDGGHYTDRHGLEKATEDAHRIVIALQSKAPEPLPRCAFGVRCEDHGYVHGWEAEELRSRLEKLWDEYSGADTEDFDVHDAARAIRKILDEVDAHDSLAYLTYEKEEAAREAAEAAAEEHEP